MLGTNLHLPQTIIFLTTSRTLKILFLVVYESSFGEERSSYHNFILKQYFLIIHAIRISFHSLPTSCYHHFPPNPNFIHSSEGKASHEESNLTFYLFFFWGLTKVLLSISRMSKVSLQIEWAPKKSVQSLAVSPVPTASDPTDYPSHATGTHILRALLGSIQVTPLSIWTQRASTSSSSCGYPQHGLDPFACTIVPPLFPLYSQTSVQSWVMYLCICFRQLLNEQWQLR